MGWFGPSGNCGCCGGETACGGCTSLTYITLSGLSNADCASGCDAKNGTYVFRSTGDPMPENCSWCPATWGGDNCGLDDDPGLYVRGVGQGANCESSFCVQLIPITGGIRVLITLILATLEEGATPKSQNTIVRFRKDFADCASISGNIPWLSTVTSDCGGAFGTTLSGDLCGAASATVTIG